MSSTIASIISFKELRNYVKQIVNNIAAPDFNATEAAATTPTDVIYRRNRGSNCTKD